MLVHSRLQHNSDNKERKNTFKIKITFNRGTVLFRSFFLAQRFLKLGTQENVRSTVLKLRQLCFNIAISSHRATDARFKRDFTTTILILTNLAQPKQKQQHKSPPSSSVSFFFLKIKLNEKPGGEKKKLVAEKRDHQTPRPLKSSSKVVNPKAKSHE
jgi:hypothetical protein